MSEDIGAAILDTLFRIERTLLDLRDLASVQQQPGKTLARRDLDVLGTLLPGIAGVLGDMVFTVADLVMEADDDKDLQAALERSFGVDWRHRSKVIGKLFARADGALVHGLLLSKTGTAREGALWKVSAR